MGIDWVQKGFRREKREVLGGGGEIIMGNLKRKAVNWTELSGREA